MKRRHTLRHLLQIALTALAGMSILYAAAASAGVPVELSANPVDADGQVTLGEIFENAGAAGGTFVVSRQGPTVVLDAGQLQGFAHRAGLDWANSRGLRRVIIRGGEAQPSPSPLAAAAGGNRSAAAPRNVQVLAYARSLSTGEIVQPSDVVWAQAAAAPSDAPRDAEAIIGMSARRPLREGAVVGLHDVSAPQVIRTGDTIVVTYSSGGVTLALQARAMGNAALGDAFNVRNTASNRTFEAVASGPGQALVGPDAQRLRAASPSQFALR